jgi:hypothetical protein
VDFFSSADLSGQGGKFYAPSILVFDLSSEWEQCQVAGAFHGIRQCPLMLGTGSGLTSWTDFAILTQKALEGFHLLVINHQIAVGAKLTDFGSYKVTSCWACYGLFFH